jgi:hypothetical protein
MLKACRALRRWMHSTGKSTSSWSRTSAWWSSLRRWLQPGGRWIPAVCHLAVLAERSTAGPLEVILFDGAIGAGWSWSQRDEAMARRLLAGSPPTARTLAVAGNAHTPTTPTDLGVPLGACLARQRPGIREIQVRYGGGRFWNFTSRQFAGRASAQGPVRLYEDSGELVLDLPIATEAVVPQRPQSPLPGGMKSTG